MNYTVNISNKAAADLRVVFEYIAFELRSVQNASSQLARLEKKIYSLNQMPERYRRYDEELWRSRGLRLMPVDNLHPQSGSPDRQHRAGDLRWSGYCS